MPYVCLTWRRRFLRSATPIYRAEEEDVDTETLECQVGIVEWKPFLCKGYDANMNMS